MSNTIHYELTEDEKQLVDSLKNKFFELQILLDRAARMGIEVKIDPLRSNPADMFSKLFSEPGDWRNVKNPRLSWSIGKVVFIDYPIEHSHP